MAGKRGNASLRQSLEEDEESIISPSISVISKSLRKKRAREAKEALEAVSLSGSSDRFSTPMSASLGPGPGMRSSAGDPDFVKVWGGGGRFKNVIGVGWLGVNEEFEAQGDEGAEGGDKGKKWELGVVERPWSDFVGELPAGFWEGRYGRS
jgi:U3 small nucleolar RNA-associated protein 4